MWHEYSLSRLPQRLPVCRVNLAGEITAIVLHFTWARRAHANDVDDVTSVTARPEVAVTVGRPCDDAVATRHWTLA